MNLGLETTNVSVQTTGFNALLKSFKGLSLQVPHLETCPALYWITKLKDEELSQITRETGKTQKDTTNTRPIHNGPAIEKNAPPPLCLWVKEGTSFWLQNMLLHKWTVKDWTTLKPTQNRYQIITNIYQNVNRNFSQTLLPRPKTKTN